MNKSIAVIGQGFVGGSLTTVFAERGFEVYVYDITGKVATGGINTIQIQAHAGLIENYQSKLSFPNGPSGIQLRSPELMNEFVKTVEGNSDFCKVYFVCLPTPMYDDGSADLSIIEDVLSQLASIEGNRIAVIKSTVPPGSTEAWNSMFNSQGLSVHHSPEFLREATALDDMRNQDRIIIGGPRPQVDQVRDVFRAAFPDVPIFKTSSSNSECIKYFINNFLALKVSFANEFHQMIEGLQSQRHLDVDYDRVIELATHDSRIGKSHLQVPGPMPADDKSGKLLRGFAGSCFVKDINATISLMKDLKIDPKVLNGAWEKNLEVRPERDWENLKGRAVSDKKRK